MAKLLRFVPYLQAQSLNLGALLLECRAYSQSEQAETFRMSSSFNLPEGSTNHGNPNLFCVPPSWSDLAIFFGTNYLAHAATLIPRPGQTLSETLIDTANALFIPGSGMIRAIRLLVYDIDFHRKSPPLTRAAKAGALCMVVEKANLLKAMSELDTEDTSDWFSDRFSLFDSPVYIPRSRSILGTCKIRNNAKYCLIEVPRGVPLKPYLPDDDPSSIALSSSTGFSTARSGSSSSTLPSRSPKIEVPGKIDFARILISILQLVWGISTLYNSRGNQIDLYGYAAFGLTVTPYALMSFLNLLASLVLPVHNTMYLVWNKDMKQASGDSYEGRRAGKFAGMIAEVDLKKANRKIRDELGGQRILYDEGGPFKRPVHLGIYYSFYLIVAVLPLAIVGAFTGFRTGSDLHIQRAWILAWLVIGSASPILISNLSASFNLNQRATFLQRSIWQMKEFAGLRDPSDQSLGLFVLLVLLPLWIPAIGGMVVVGRMLQDFGVCTRLD